MMGLAVTNVLVVVCAMLAASYPSANAFPMALYHRNNMVFFQQSSTTNTVTEALVVSVALKFRKDMHITMIFLYRVL